MASIMQISELKPKQGSVELAAEVVEKGDIREFNKFGKQGRVCNAKIKDESGTMALTLWNEQIDQVKVGDRIQIKNGYVNEWQGESQLTTGKFGSLEVIGPAGDDNVQAVTDDELKEESTVEQDTQEATQPLSQDEKTEEQDLEELNKPTGNPESSATEDEQLDLDVEEEKIE
ncbi:hypothetical protein GF345_06010 [Candidatus Woesearchaeota archaeon]|nr:hypothetical protein [Candidatus Woesearchaeota archaeon]